MVSNGHGAQICNWCADIAAQVISTQRAAAGEAEYTSWIESLNTTDDRPSVRSITELG